MMNCDASIARRPATVEAFGTWAHTASTWTAGSVSAIASEAIVMTIVRRIPQPHPGRFVAEHVCTPGRGRQASRPRARSALEPAPKEVERDDEQRRREDDHPRARPQRSA